MNSQTRGAARKTLQTCTTCARPEPHNSHWRTSTRRRTVKKADLWASKEWDNRTASARLVSAGDSLVGDRLTDENPHPSAQRTLQVRGQGGGRGHMSPVEALGVEPRPRALHDNLHPTAHLTADKVSDKGPSPRSPQSHSLQKQTRRPAISHWPPLAKEYNPQPTARWSAGKVPDEEDRSTGEHSGALREPLPQEGYTVTDVVVTAGGGTRIRTWKLLRAAGTR